MPTDTMEGQGIVERFRRARRDPALAVLEGFHPLKHALRFGAGIVQIVTRDRDHLSRLARDLAPDVADVVAAGAESIAADVFRRLAPRPPPTGVIAIARRREVSLADLLDDPRAEPIVVLENAARLENLGAAVRVAAAAGAAGVIALGRHDPWHPAALRGGAGLQYALPVARAEALPESGRPLVAFDPAGEPLRPGTLPPRALLAFGSERRGLSGAILDRADLVLGIPMRAGVSSLNLVTAVAVALYTERART